MVFFVQVDLLVSERYRVFIQTNRLQALPAKIAAYALSRNSPTPERFSVTILQQDDFPFINDRHDQPYLREGRKEIWHADVLQSFTPLRFAPPEIMGYQGRALVIDPDVFAIGDVFELLSRDMKGAALMVRARLRPEGEPEKLSSAVMLLDCAKLRHWRLAQDFAELFDFTRDYKPWLDLKLERRETIGLFEPEWNDFDHLGPETRLLHTTRQITQPWRTGLPVTEVLEKPSRPRRGRLASWLKPSRTETPRPFHRTHPDPLIEQFFLTLARESLEKGVIGEAEVRAEIAHGHLRADLFEAIDQAEKAA
jgi:hypothetical protein